MRIKYKIVLCFAVLFGFIFVSQTSLVNADLLDTTQNTSDSQKDTPVPNTLIDQTTTDDSQKNQKVITDDDLSGEDFTMKVGDPVPTAKEFQATCKDSAGKDQQVTVDLNQADLNKPGKYQVKLSTPDGQTKTVFLTVLKNDSTEQEVEPAPSQTESVKNNKTDEPKVTDETEKVEPKTQVVANNSGSVMYGTVYCAPVNSVKKNNQAPQTTRSNGHMIYLPQAGNKSGFIPKMIGIVIGFSTLVGIDLKKFH
ncbi:MULTISPECIES: hypothetical protein [unclassified Companilactobacillus]|uniref:hypothetical protein n=1 Tax=unclassified Companilactobacillus TaxID=2767904 RepID=UPI002FF083B6